MKHIVLVLIVGAAMFGSTAIADPFVTATYAPLQSGYRLEFVVYADSLRGFSGWGLNTTALTDLAFPPNWAGGVGIRSTEWYTLLGPEYYIPPGGVLRGCAATSAEQPGPMDYFVRQTGEGESAYYGTVVPTLIPEPTSLLALAAGVVAVAGLALRRRRAGR